VLKVGQTSSQNARQVHVTRTRARVSQRKMLEQYGQVIAIILRTLCHSCGACAVRMTQFFKGGLLI